MKFLINDTRGAFLSLFESSSFEGGAAKYNGKFIIPKNHKQIAALDEAMFKVAQEKWGAKARQIYDNLVKDGKKPEVAFVKGPYKNRDGDVYDGFEDAYYVTASSSKRPGIFDRNRQPLVAADGKPYPGCFLNVQIELWAQDNTFGRAIRAELKGVQFLRDGDAFGGGGPPAKADDFDDLGDQGGEDMADDFA